MNTVFEDITSTIEIETQRKQETTSDYIDEYQTAPEMNKQEFPKGCIKL